MQFSRWVVVIITLCRSQPAAVRQAVLSVYTSAVSWAQEKLLRNLIKEHGLIDTVLEESVVVA